METIKYQKTITIILDRDNAKINRAIVYHKTLLYLYFISCASLFIISQIPLFAPLHSEIFFYEGSFHNLVSSFFIPSNRYNILF